MRNVAAITTCRYMNLTDEETLALVNLLEHTIREDAYPLGPRVRMLKGILDKLVEPRPGGEPLPPRRAYEQPSKGRYRRRPGARGRGIVHSSAPATKVPREC